MQPKHSVTSVFDRLFIFVNDGTYLWIKTPVFAWAFLIALVINAVVLLIINVNEPRGLLANIYLPAKSGDYLNFSSRFAHATHNISDDRKLVLLIGGSGARELSGSERFLTEKLNFMCASNYHFINAGTSNQTFAETWAIIDAVPNERLAAVFVGMNFLRLSETRSETIRRAKTWRIPFDLPDALKESTQIWPGFSGLFQAGWMFKNMRGMKYYTSKEALMATDDPFNGVQNLYRDTPWNLQQKQISATENTIVYEGRYSDKHQESLDLWLEFASKLKAQKINLSFIVLPQSPSAASARNLFEKTLNTQLTAFESAGFKMIDWRNLPELSEADFHDPHHIMRNGRKKITPRLLSFAAGQLPDCDTSRIKMESLL